MSPRPQPAGWKQPSPDLVEADLIGSPEQRTQIEAILVGAGCEVVSRRQQSEGARLIQGRGPLRGETDLILCLPPERKDQGTPPAPGDIP